MGDAASWATTASNKFREVQRSSGSSTTELLAEGLSALAAAVRELDHQLDSLERRVLDQ